MKIKVTGYFFEKKWVAVVRNLDDIAYSGSNMTKRVLDRYEFPADSMSKKQRDKFKLTMRKMWETRIQLEQS